MHGEFEPPPDLKAREAATGQACPERFLEGSMEFKALFHPGDVSESFIKALETRYLGGYEYVVQQTGACHSGAITA